jgi:hypothetical protein
VFHAVLEPHPDAPEELRPLAARLAGPALVRFSGALWKHADCFPDVLGCAIRLRRDERDTAVPGDDDQDLLFSTVLRPWTVPISPLLTRVRDYLANDYYAVSPFEVGLTRPVYLRLQPARESKLAGGTRTTRLLHEVELGSASLFLDVGKGPFGPWSPCLSVALERAAPIDGEALRFRPFRAGRGVHPHGFVHALRIGVYSFSQRARPAGAGQRLAPLGARQAGQRSVIVPR